jgi:putative nucleotidyltransferase with HDIG domain
MNEVEILIVEDNSSELELALYALKKHRIANHIVVLRDGAEVLEYLFGTQNEPPPPNKIPKLILLDLKLPKINGIEVLRRIKAEPRTQSIPIVVMTSSRQDQDLEECYRLGVNSYLVKPVNIESANLRALTEGQYNDETGHTRKDKSTFPGQSHISLLRDESSSPIGLIHTLRDITERKQAEEKIKQLLIDLQKKNEELALAYDATLGGWVRFLDLRDQETEGHTQRVTEMTTELAALMGFNSSLLLQIRRGALLHDIGKMGIPDNVLRKPGPLNNEEREIMRRHPVYAYQMLAPIEFLHPALGIPHHHHERWDGSGYPDQLCREAIPRPPVCHHRRMGRPQLRPPLPQSLASRKSHGLHQVPIRQTLRPPTCQNLPRLPRK